MELLLEINYIEVVEVSSNQVWLITLYSICLCTDTSMPLLADLSFPLAKVQKNLHIRKSIRIFLIIPTDLTD